MRTKIVLFLAVSAIISLHSCTNNQTGNADSTIVATSPSPDSAKVNGIAYDLKLPGIHFTKAVNGAETLAKVDVQHKITFNVGEKKDYFSDPDGKLSNNTAPILLAKVDNKKPFTLIAKVTPTFTSKGLYNAGVLYIYVNNNFYQKFCFEQDERGEHRLVTVRTIGTSDDNNHDVVKSPFVYMKLSSDTRTVASYYSIDKKNWQMVRLYKNNYPATIWMGLSAQCPKDVGSVSYFEDISLVQKSVNDVRLGTE